MLRYAAPASAPTPDADISQPSVRASPPNTSRAKIGIATGAAKPVNAVAATSRIRLPMGAKPNAYDTPARSSERVRPKLFATAGAARSTTRGTIRASEMMTAT